MDNEEGNQIVSLNDVDSAQIVGKKGLTKKHKIIIFSVLGVTVLLILIIVILIIISSQSQPGNNENNNNNNNNIPIKGSIKCVYNIEGTSSKTQIIGNDYLLNSNIDFLIDGEKEKFTKDYQFSSSGFHEIEINLYENNIYMDKMFQNIKTLISVELVPNKMK